MCKFLACFHGKIVWNPPASLWVVIFRVLSTALLAISVRDCVVSLRHSSVLSLWNLLGSFSWVRVQEKVLELWETISNTMSLAFNCDFN